MYTIVFYLLICWVVSDCVGTLQRLQSHKINKTMFILYVRIALERYIVTVHIFSLCHINLILCVHAHDSSVVRVSDTLLCHQRSSSSVVRMSDTPPPLEI